MIKETVFVFCLANTRIRRLLHQRRLMFRTFLITTIVLLISGCGAEYSVTHVSSDEILKDKGGTGFYFNFPLTEIGIQLTTKSTTYDDGEYRNIGKLAQLCTRALSGDKKAAKLVEESLKHNRSNKTDIVVTRVRMESHPAQDPENWHRLEITADIFTEVLHTLDLTPLGTPEKATNKVVSKGAELVTAIVDTITQGVSIFNKSLAPTPSPSILPALLRDCRSVLAVNTQIASYRLDVQRENTASRLKKQQFIEKASFAVNPIVAEKLFTLYDQELERDLKAITKTYIADLKKAGLVNKEKLQVLTTDVIPYGADGTCTQNDLQDPTKCRWRPISEKEEIGFAPFAPKSINDVISAVAPTLEVNPVDQTISCYVTGADGSLTNRCKTPKTGGYPYRLPVPAEVKLSLKHGADSKEVQGRFVIAQLGPIVRSTSKAPGAGGQFDVTYHPDSGALKTATIGFTPIAPSIISDTSGKVFGVLEERKSAKEAKREAELTQDLDALNRQSMTLQAIKNINELRSALGLEPIDVKPFLTEF